MLTKDKPTVYTLKYNSLQINQHNFIKFVYLRFNYYLSQVLVFSPPPSLHKTINSYHTQYKICKKNKKND